MYLREVYRWKQATIYKFKENLKGFTMQNTSAKQSAHLTTTPKWLHEESLCCVTHIFWLDFVFSVSYRITLGNWINFSAEIHMLTKKYRPYYEETEHRYRKYPLAIIVNGVTSCPQGSILGDLFVFQDFLIITFLLTWVLACLLNFIMSFGFTVFRKCKMKM